jgi:hypothetical protein
VASIVTPETLLAWHEKLIAQKYDGGGRRRPGLQRFFVLFFMELCRRKVELAGIASAAWGLWMSQIGRNLTDVADGILHGQRYLIHDRDPLFTAEFLDLLGSVGVKSVKLPARSPNLNATRKDS